MTNLRQWAEKVCFFYFFFPFPFLSSPLLHRWTHFTSFSLLPSPTKTCDPYGVDVDSDSTLLDGRTLVTLVTAVEGSLDADWADVEEEEPFLSAWRYVHLQMGFGRSFEPSGGGGESLHIACLCFLAHVRAKELSISVSLDGPSLFCPRFPPSSLLLSRFSFFSFLFSTLSLSQRLNQIWAVSHFRTPNRRRRHGGP